MFMKNWAKAVDRMLGQGQRLVLALVLNQDGSTPRGTGTRMILGPETIGTIGGGWIEACVMQTAREMLGKPGAVIRSFDLTSQIADGMDMICGGHMDILIESLIPDEQNCHVFSNLSRMLNGRQEGCLITEIRESEADSYFVRRQIHPVNETGIDPLTIPDTVCDVLDSAIRSANFPVVANDGSRRFLIESIAPDETVYLFGAGHVSLQTAIVSQLIGFETVILDDRPAFANPERFPNADEIRVIPSFDQALDGLVIDGKSYIVILTRGHLHDKTVLGQALQTPARYIGMIGSRKKRDAIYTALAAEGFTQTDLQRVHSPVGLPIGAQTPEEIAVSIAAELIRVRREQ